MTDLKISKQTQSIKKSLALRVFLICLCIFVIPLLIHSFVIYKKEFDQKKKDLFLALHVLGESRAFLIDSLLIEQKRYLQNLSTESGDILTEAKSDYPDYNYFLSKEAPKGGLTYFAGEGNLFVSVPRPKKKDYLYAEIPADPLLKRLSVLESFNYPYELALLDQSNYIFASSEPKIIPKVDMERSAVEVMLQSEIKVESFRFTDPGGRGYAVMVKVQKLDMPLLTFVKENDVRASYQTTYWVRFIWLLALVLLVGGSLAFYLVWRLSKPLWGLCSVMEKVKKGNMQARYLKDSMGFEINILGEFFNDTLEAVLHHQRIAEVERAAKLELLQEFKIGHEIQKSMLPVDMPSFATLDIAAGCRPAKEVGGDFYDLFEVNGKLALLIADTSGKGISACLFALTLRSMLRSYICSGQSLAKAVVDANNLFCRDTRDSGMFVTAWVGLYDEKTGMLEYLNAGHPPSILLRKNGITEELSTPGIALGAKLLEEQVVSKVELRSGDLLLLYTDGVTEEENEAREFFGKARLEEYIHKPHKSAREMVGDLLFELNAFSQKRRQNDDTTILVIKKC